MWRRRQLRGQATGAGRNEMEREERAELLGSESQQEEGRPGAPRVLPVTS